MLGKDQPITAIRTWMVWVYAGHKAWHWNLFNRVKWHCDNRSRSSCHMPSLLMLQHAWNWYVVACGRYQTWPVSLFGLPVRFRPVFFPHPVYRLRLRLSYIIIPSPSRLRSISEFSLHINEQLESENFLLLSIHIWRLPLLSPRTDKLSINIAK